MYRIVLFLLTFFTPFLEATKQQLGPNTTTVDLGYALYTGIYNTSTRLTVWKGIRYAAPPTGKLRWQAPREPPPPQTNGGQVPVELASRFGNACPQVLSNKPGANGVFLGGVTGSSEDCLFLSVWSSFNNDTKGLLPVLVVVHGGGYGLGDGRMDMSDFVLGVGREPGIVVVGIQYRLGAFGFLASPEIKNKGVLNAGILDQRFALEWIQKHIHKFGGDKERVTVQGESAGGGSVLLHAVANEGRDGNRLFKNLIAASPWIPTQPYYNDTQPVRDYYNFAALAGCPSQGQVFDCLVGKDSLTLQYAAHLVSTNSPTPFGNWAFKPVTDGTYITGPPSTVLYGGKVNGERVLVGNNANEGPLIPPATIRTQEDLIAWLKNNFPNLSQTNITNILATYPSSEGPVNTGLTGYETSGYGPATAVNISQVATGQQQRCFNIYAEAAVICPAYWLASAFSTQRKAAWYYQYSVPFAVHGADITAYFGPPTENQGPDLVNAFRKIYGNFIINDNPSISNLDANGLSSPTPNASNPASNWPRTETNLGLLNINQTGGVPYAAVSAIGVPVTQFRNPGLRNNFTFADAYMWEGGRGKRCEFWRQLGPFVPE